MKIKMNITTWNDVFKWLLALCFFISLSFFSAVLGIFEPINLYFGVPAESIIFSMPFFGFISYMNARIIMKINWNKR